MKKRVAILLLAAALLLSVGGYAFAEEFFGFSGEEEFFLGTDGGDNLGYIEVNGISYGDGTTGFIYNDEWLLEDPTVVSGDLAKVSMALSGAAYDKTLVKEMIESIDYEVIGQDDYQPKSYDESDSVAFSVGKKKIGGRTAYCIAIRGTGGEAGAWASDFNLGNPVYNEGNHEGFHNAADRMQAKLESIIDLSNDPILWFTGHSRGAAVANILAARYTASHTVFAYTFACPAVSKSAVTEGYENIINFNNAGDAVPAMPLYEWGYRRYGITFEFGVQDDVAFNMSHYTEEGGQNASASNTMHYEDIMRTLFPTESDVDSPIGRYFTGILSCILGTDHNVGNVMGYVQSGVFEDAFYNPLSTVTTVYELYQYMAELFPKLSGYVTTLTSAISEISKADDEDAAFAEWLANNQDIVDEIAETTGITIKTKSDMLTVIDLCNKQLTKPSERARLLQGIAALVDLATDGNGNPLLRIMDGHKGPTYVLGINSKFFGYQAYMNSPVESATIPTTLNARFPNQEYPVSVKTIGTRCFYRSTVSTINNTAQLEYIGNSAFSYCVDLQSIDITNISQLCDYSFNGCSCLQVISLGNNLKSIGNHAFADCASLKAIDLGDRLKNIGYYAFWNCVGLEELYIPDSVKNIAVLSHYYGEYTGTAYEGPFWGCTGLKEINIGGPEIITRGMFKTGSHNIEKLTIRGTVKEIGDRAFSSVNVGSGIYNLYENDYYSNSGHPVVLLINEGVETIGTSAFSSCKAFTSVSIPSTVSMINSFAFSDCENLNCALLLECVSEIRNHAFSDCKGLSEVTFGEKLKSIGIGAFSNCIGLTSITIPSGVLRIEEQAFSDCSGLKCITFKEGLKSIGQNAFLRCFRMNSVTIPKSLTDIEFHAFSGCRGLKDVYYPSSPANWSMINIANGNDYLIHATIHYSVLNLVPDFLLPAALTEIDEEAFAGGAFAYVKLSENTTTIGENAFADCPNLVYIYIPAATVNIDPLAFGEIQRLLIIGEAGSSVETYAQEHNYTFMAFS